MNPALVTNYRETTHSTLHCLNCTKCKTVNAAGCCNKNGDAPPPEGFVVSIVGLSQYIRNMNWVVAHATDDNHVCDEFAMIPETVVSRMVITRGSGQLPP